MDNSLDVYFKNIFAGKLFKSKSKNTLTFIYDPAYLKSENPEQISASLPLSTEEHENYIVEPFFAGLLPEENAKAVIAKLLKTDVRNTFNLLEHLGGDCAGAIATYKSGTSPNNNETNEYKTLDDKEACDVLCGLKQRPLHFGEDDFRISGAGAQDKLIACIIDDKLALPLNGTPSTHILKPNIYGYTDSVYNELFCMQLAKKCGLTVPNTFIKTFCDIPFYVVERYDRKQEGDTWQRIHQEDFCQLLHVLPEHKYESDGGPSLQACFELLNSLKVEGPSKIAFLDLVIFNFLIGNGDAHGKNFSILYKDKIPELAPCYDLMCTAIMAPHYKKSKMAMKLGSSDYGMSYVMRKNFTNLASISAYREDYILKRVYSLAETITAKAETLAHELNQNKQTESEVFGKIIDIIKKHAERILTKDINKIL